ncbi:MAG: CinA family protein [Micrococcaceae bacterium]
MTTAAEVVELLIAHGRTIATAESLTAGAVAARLADVSGASRTLRGGVVAYQNDIKANLLGVDRERLESHGAVDEQVSLQMADGARRQLGADMGVATTGVAGPHPHQGQPAGTVWIAVVAEEARRAQLYRFEGDRAAVRQATVDAALQLIVEVLHDSRA